MTIVAASAFGDSEPASATVGTPVRTLLRDPPACFGRVVISSPLLACSHSILPIMSMVIPPQTPPRKRAAEQAEHPARFQVGTTLKSGFVFGRRQQWLSLLRSGGAYSPSLSAAVWVPDRNSAAPPADAPGREDLQGRVRPAEWAEWVVFLAGVTAWAVLPADVPVAAVL